MMEKEQKQVREKERWVDGEKRRKKNNTEKNIYCPLIFDEIEQ